MRYETYTTDIYYRWELFLANRNVDRVISLREERASRALAEFLYLLCVSKILVDYDDYC